MRRGFCLLVVFGFVFAFGGCAGNDSAWTSDGGAGFDGGSVSDFGAQCASISIMSTFDYTPSTLTARTTAVGSGPTWTVDTPTGQKTPAAIDGSGLIVFTEATVPGTYTFRLHLDQGQTCINPASKVIEDANSLGQVYTLRVTPPASSKLPQQESALLLKGNTEQLAKDLMLVEGTPLAGTLTGPTGPVAGEVDLTPVSGPTLRTVVDNTGKFELPIAIAGTYFVRLLPISAALAPRSFGPVAGAALFSTSFAVDAGEAVLGSVTDASNVALPGAKLALHDGALTSGLGTAATDGTFSLRATQSTYTLAVSAPQRPDLTLDSVVVPAAGTSIIVKHSLARVAVTPKVLALDGTTLVPNAVVTFTSAPLTNAGTITVGGSVHAVTGVVRARCVSGNDGTCTAQQLPVGTYTALIEPPLGWPGDSGARTALQATVTAAGALTLQLAQSLSVTGHVQRSDGTPVANARVRARSRGNPLAVEQLSDANGDVTLLADPGLPLEVWVDALPAAHLASGHRQLGDADSPYVSSLPSLGSVTLGPALTISGVVFAPGNSPVANAAIDVLCASCADLTPIAHAETNGNGVYLLELPDPGLQVFDGGTD